MSGSATSTQTEIEQKGAKVPLRYMPQLDGLRALAVLSVWQAHWGIEALPVIHWIRWGELGVLLFFALSGFLITGILLQAKVGVDQGNRTLAGAAGNFYMRRFLRILPIYYITIFVIFALLPSERKFFWWEFTYTSNIYIGMHTNAGWAGSHFWTLAVEEQFYLIWPWLILTMPKKWLLPTIIAAALSGIAVRGGLYMLHHHGRSYRVDEFAVGALLAILSSEPRLSHLRDTFMRWCLRLGLPALIVATIMARGTAEEMAAAIFLPFFAVVFFAWLIGRAADGFSGPVGAFLQWGPMLYIGRVSYGMYVFHNFIGPVWKSAGMHEPDNVFVRFLLFGTIGMVLATISWFLIEKPINSLKRYFPVDRKTQKTFDTAPSLAMAPS